MSIELYGDLMSQPVRAVYWFLLLNDIPFNFNSIRLVKGEQRSPEYLKINPFGTVPTITDEGFSVNESATIVRYLSSTRDIVDHWFPSNPQLRAEVDRYLDWHHSNIRISASNLFRNKFIGMSSLFQDGVLEKMLKKNLGQIENIFLAEGKWIGGMEQPSFADLQCFDELLMLSLTDIVLDEFPRIVSFMRECRNIPFFDEVHVVFHKVLRSRQGKL